MSTDYRGMSLTDALARAEQLGAKVERGHHGGEVRVSHPLLRRRVCISASRKSAPRALASALHQLETAGARLRAALGL